MKLYILRPNLSPINLDRPIIDFTLLSKIKILHSNIRESEIAKKIQNSVFERFSHDQLQFLQFVLCIFLHL